MKTAVTSRAPRHIASAAGATSRNESCKYRRGHRDRLVAAGQSCGSPASTLETVFEAMRHLGPADVLPRSRERRISNRIRSSEAKASPAISSILAVSVSTERAQQLPRVFSRSRFAHGPLGSLSCQIRAAVRQGLGQMACAPPTPAVARGRACPRRRGAPHTGCARGSGVGCCPPWRRRPPHTARRDETRGTRLRGTVRCVRRTRSVPHRAATLHA